MDNSMLRFKIFADDHLRQRVTAIFMNDLWDNEDKDIQTPVPLESLMWAIAANDSILNGVIDRMSQQGEDSAMYDPAIKQVADSDLEYVILSVALPRFKKREDDIKAERDRQQAEFEEQQKAAQAEAQQAEAAKK